VQIKAVKSKSYQSKIISKDRFGQKSLASTWENTQWGKEEEIMESGFSFLAC
jgi:hypothetical protein